ERRLTGAVRPDQPDDFSGRDVKRHVLERLQPAETLADPADLQNGSAHPELPLRKRAVPSLKNARMPRGWIRMTAISARPKASCDRPATREERYVFASSSIGMMKNAPMIGPA